MYKIYLNGTLYRTGNIPQTIPGVKLSRLDLATTEQLAVHGITLEEYTPPEPEPLTPEQEAAQLQTQITSAIQSMLDAKAKEFNFDSINTASGWQGKLPMATELVNWGADCWVKSYEIRDVVIAGERAIPSVEDVLAEMPDWGDYV